MKIRKRLLSLTLAVMLIVAMAVPASAASFPFSSTYAGCSYNTSNNCGTNSYSCVIEVVSCDGDYENYLVQPMVSWFWNDGCQGTTVGSKQAYISSTSKYIYEGLSYIYCYHFINDNQVVGPLRVNAG